PGRNRDSMRQMYYPEPDVSDLRPYRVSNSPRGDNRHGFGKYSEFFPGGGCRAREGGISAARCRQCAMPLERASPGLTRNSRGIKARKISPSTLKSSMYDSSVAWLMMPW